MYQYLNMQITATIFWTTPKRRLILCSASTVCPVDMHSPLGECGGTMWCLAAWLEAGELEPRVPMLQALAILQVMLQSVSSGSLLPSTSQMPPNRDAGTARTPACHATCPLPGRVKSPKAFSSMDVKKCSQCRHFSESRHNVESLWLHEKENRDDALPPEPTE